MIGGGSRVEFLVLGPLEVRDGGSAVGLGGVRQRALLAMLLLNANRVVSKERLIDELDGGSPADGDGAHKLRVQVSRLRAALPARDGDQSRLVTRAPGYVLHVDPGELDLDVFTDLLEQGRDAAQVGDHALAAALLQRAGGLWRGRPLADLEFEPFARLEIEQLDQLHLIAREERIDAELALGRHAALVPELELLTGEHPLRERLRAQLMLALYRCGRQTDALSVYHQTSELLRHEHGIDPSRQLQELERSILQHDTSLELKPPRAQAPVQLFGFDEGSRGSGPIRPGERRELAMLFVDIEGSTQLARAYGERWGAALARHHELICGTVQERFGHVEQIVGDRALLLFEDAQSGFSAAVSLQRAFANEVWSGPVLKTRMGLHVGLVSRPSTVLVGLEIHRAARVSAAANGGQLIVTERVRRDLDGMVRLEDLGEFRLKNFPEAQRLFHAVIGGGGAAAYPPLRALPVRMNNLPPVVGTLHGRDSERRQLTYALRQNRLVTVVGAGGVGKSRLALAVAMDALDECDGGVWWVSLESFTDTTMLASEIAGALGARGSDAYAAIAERTSGRRTVVVLDNAEHLLPEVGAEISRVLRSAADLTCLVTSQRRLGLSGEHLIRIDGLLPAASRALLCERAAAARPGITIAPGVVDAICARADHHPLTLELAAGRLAVLSPAQLLDRMDQLLPLLGNPHAGRRESLSRSVEWTLSLLEPSARSAFVHLGIFAGNMPIDFAELVIDRPTLLDDLQALADLAIVRLDESGDRSPTLRLSPPLREAAMSRLSVSLDRERLAERHFDAVVAYLAPVRWSIAARDSARARAAVVTDEIRAARAWAQHDQTRSLVLAANAGEFWTFSGRLADGIQWLERVTTIRSATDAWALAIAARARVTCGLGPDAAAGILTDADEAVAVLDGAGPRERAQGLIARALACAHSGLTDRAAADAASARDAATGDAELLFIATVLSAHIHAIFDDEQTGRALLDAAQTLPHDPDLYLAGALPTLSGDFALMRDDGPAAASAYATSLDWASRRHDLQQVTNDLAGLAAALAASGDGERALEVLGIAERCAADLGRPVKWVSAFTHTKEQRLARAHRLPGAEAALHRGHTVPPGLRVTRALQLHTEATT